MPDRRGATSTQDDSLQRAGRPSAIRSMETTHKTLTVLRCKLVIVGDAKVGKTALAQMFHSGGHNFPKNYVMTIGVDFSVKVVSIPETSTNVELYMFDSAGSRSSTSSSTGTPSGPTHPLSCSCSTSRTANRSRVAQNGSQRCNGRLMDGAFLVFWLLIRQIFGSRAAARSLGAGSGLCRTTGLGLL